MPEPDRGRDPARARFYIIAGQRLLGAGLIMLGLLAVNGALAWGAAIGWALLALGLVDFAIVPILLARLWRSPRR